MPDAIELTPALLVAATGCRQDIADHVARYLDIAMQARDLFDPLENAAHFLAQTAHESMLYTRTEESFAYSAARLCAVWPTRFYLPPDDAKGRIDASTLVGKPASIAEAVYGGRTSLGNVKAGDGALYRGRGFLQLTGRDAYTAFAMAEPKYPAVSVPDVVASTEGAAASAAWFWTAHGLTVSVRAGATVERVTKVVNGGLIGLAERQALTDRARRAFGI